MSFQQGLSGLNAASKTLEAIGNNIANANTVGFKSSAVNFADVYANSLTGSGGSGVTGIGVKVSQVSQQFSQGNITASANPLDIAINGGGFFRLSNNGSITYARNGQFQLDSTGYIISPTGSRLTGFSVNDQGVLLTGAPSEIQIDNSDIPPKITTSITQKLTLDSRKPDITVPFDINDPKSYSDSTSVNVFDSLGNEHVLQTYYVKTGANTWQVHASNDGVPITGAQTGGSIGILTFDGSTGLVDTATPALPFPISLTTTTGATSPYTVNLDMTGTKQFGSTFSVNTNQPDGYASGRMTGFNIGADGMITGRYTNGQTAVLGQVVLANFPNANGLQPLGNNTWAETSVSGQAMVGAPNTGRFGVLQSSAVEDSNTDLTGELVTMITAQRVYQANAQTIKTQDQVLQTLVNLR